MHELEFLLFFCMLKKKKDKNTFDFNIFNSNGNQA